MLARLAIGSIGLYQRRISPYKGFSCAHRLRHGSPGCSAFASMTIRQYGLVRAVPLIRERFAACRDAAEELRAGGERREKDDRWWHSCDCSGCPDIDPVPDCCSL